MIDAIKSLGRRIQSWWDTLRRKPPRPQPQPDPAPPPDPIVPPPDPIPPPQPEQPWFRWEPHAHHCEMYIPSWYRVWRISILTGQGHKHVHPYDPQGTGIWYYDDRGTPAGNGLHKFVIPVAPHDLHRRATGFGMASADLLLIHCNTEATAENGIKSVGWFIRPTRAVADSPTAGIRNYDNRWQGRP